jgi:translation initiation factor 3 subunit G
MTEFRVESFEQLEELREYDIINDKEYDRLFRVLCCSHNREEDDEREPDPESELAPAVTPQDPDFEVGTTETLDEDGIITRVIQSIDSEGRKIRTVQKVKRITREIKVPRRVIERRKLAKFGRCAGKPSGPEPGVTSFGEVVFLEAPADKTKLKEQKKKAQEDSGGTTIVCRKCGEPGHWTMHCTYSAHEIQSRKEAMGMSVSVSESLTESIESTFDSLSESLDNSNRYVPPGKRQSSSGPQQSDVETEGPKTNIRITNLDEEATDRDLYDLFGRIGKLKSARVITDRNTGASRGFAYVDFENEEDAQSAMDRLQGYAYGKQILGLSWAKPKRNK